MKKVLIIEDNDEIRENISEILELEGFSVHAAENGRNGLDMVGRVLPDAIICDIMMPVLDGYQLLEIRKNDDYLSKVPVIVLSAQTEKKELNRAIELGAYGFIRKPFESDELLALLRKAIE